MPEDLPRDILNREPPNNLDAERSVLAAMILDQEVCEDAIAIVKVDHFYRPSHQLIYAAIQELQQGGTPVDQVTLADKLEAKGDLDKIGGKGYILELANLSMSVLNWQAYARIIKTDAMMRELIKAAVRIQAIGYSDADDSDKIVADAEAELFNVTDRALSHSAQKIVPLMEQMVEQVEEMCKDPNKIFGVPSGYRDLDNLLAGFRSGQLIVVGASTGMGKTSLALNLAVNAALAGTRVIFYSLEMPAIELTQRVASYLGSIELAHIRKGRMQQEDWKNLPRVEEQLMKCDLCFDESPSLSVTELLAKSRRHLRNTESGKGLIVVDYLQLMNAGGSGGGYSDQQRYQEVGKISRGLKMISKELGQPVIALSQLNRTATTTGTHVKPQLSMLRESGSIEQDADVVLLLDRSTSAEEAENHSRPDLGTANLIVAKNRNGETREEGIVLTFLKQYASFYDYTAEQ
ncbi:MAG: replicative DNA helicase [Coriobacteriales bacterium]|jgi:replicative DNA helicase|nr:replicative DNA helicase [Coriobacteriales bacterium]